jgi:hypothetical protein
MDTIDIQIWFIDNGFVDILNIVKHYVNLYEQTYDRTDSNYQIISGIITMLNRRTYVDSHGLRKPVLNPGSSIINMKYYGILNDLLDSNFCIIKTTFEGKYIIHIIYNKLDISREYINYFINNYPNDNKMIIVEGYTDRLEKYLAKRSIQIFRISDIKNIYNNTIEYPICVPIDPANPKFMIVANTINKKPLFHSISLMSPEVKYHNFKKGDIIQITHHTFPWHYVGQKDDRVYLKVT